MNSRLLAATAFLLQIVLLLSGCGREHFGDDAHLVFLGAALRSYSTEHARYPANICDKQGKPLLSWRVVILQHGMEFEQYKKFHLDEPWNSAHNLAVAQEIPEMYRDPQGSRFTPYLGITGDRAAFRPGNPRVYDPQARFRAVVVTVKDSDVFWSEPRDISLEEVKKGDRLRWSRTSIGKLVTYFADSSSAFDTWAKDPDSMAKRKIEFEADNMSHQAEADLVHQIVIGNTLQRCKAAMAPFVDNIYDKAGKPLLSWRVALLQYGNIDDMALYKKFHLDEPWNSPYNLKLAQEIPEHYRDPQGTKSTPYLAVTGEKAAFRPRNPRLWRSLTPKCAMVVTVRNSDVFWSEPRDISAPEAEKGDRLRWVGSATIYLNGSLNHDEWRKGDTGQFCTPEFELPADADN